MTTTGKPTKRRVADLIAGLSVALVLVPQSMAYAELAGMPPHYGLYASAIPLILAAFFASSPYLQTGPVALTSLLAFAALTSVSTPGTPEYVGMAALLALVVGAVRVLIGVMGGGAISYLMSQPVLRGFTAAAAVLILGSQLPKVFGMAPDGGVIEAVVATVSNPGAWDTQALIISGVTLVLMLGGKKLHPLFPGVLIAVIFGITYAALTGYSGPTIGQVPNVIVPPLSFDLPWARLPELLIPGSIIALVGFAEAASIAQAFAEQTRNPWDPSKEFTSQGVANLAAGVLSGFPVGGSLSRSAINKTAGAQTRWSGAITGVAVLLFLPFASVLSPLPLAVLGAIVVGAVLKLLDPRPLVTLWSQSRVQGLVGFVTFGTTLWLAPHIESAILIGIATALAVHVWREQAFEVRAESRGRTLVLTPEGVIWFGSAPLFRRALVKALAERPFATRVVIDLSHVGRIDLTGALALKEVVERGREVDTQVVFAAIPPHAERILGKVCGGVPCTELGEEE